jgi:hypothetical protein
MKRLTSRTLKLAVLVPAAMMLLVATAFALEQTNGTGKTNSGNSIGYNAKCTEALVDNRCPDGKATGHLTFEANNTNNTNNIVYTDPVFGDLKDIKCNDYNSYRLEFTAHGFPRTRVTATCVGTFADTTATVYIKVYFVDKGEPGTADRINFYASTNRAYRHNAELDPNRLVKDIGVISNGNVQIHTDVNPFDSTDMLVPVEPAA